MNKCVFLGRVVADPEIRYSKDEKSTPIARYSLAVRRSFQKDGSPEADFPRMVAFARNAEFAEKYLRKGRMIIVEGKFQTDQYTDKDGVTRYTHEFVVDNHYFSGEKIEDAEQRKHDNQKHSANNNGRRYR